MKLQKRTSHVNGATVGIVRAGELLDVGNILTSPRPAPGGWFARPEIG